MATTKVYYGYDEDNLDFYLSTEFSSTTRYSWTIIDGNDPPWVSESYASEIEYVIFLDTITPQVCDKWFLGFSNLIGFSTLAGTLDLSECYRASELFHGCSKLTSCPIDLTTGVGIGEWGACFKDCINLTNAPTFPSVITHTKTLPSKIGFGRTFLGCSKLQNPPTLPVSANKQFQFNRCFEDCTSLSVPPAIPDDTLEMSSTFRGCLSLTTPPTMPSSLTSAISCFVWCENLTIAPNLSNTTNLENMSGFLSGCSKITQPPVIPSGVTNMIACFQNCTSLRTAPAIPASVTTMFLCFKGCSSLAGNIEVYNTPDTGNVVFPETINDIYIVNKAGTSASGTAWKYLASQHSNVHYEADDNTVPSVAMSVTRVDSALSEVQTPMGEYAYINAQVQLYEDYLPVGWSNSLPNPNNSGSTTVITKDGTTQTVTWTDTNVGLLYALKCWINLGDILRHTFTLQTADKIVDDNNTQKASHLSAIVTQILSKAYKLVDYYHESDQSDPNYDTEGMAIGKYATQANLFDVDMPSRFRDSIVVDRLIGEIKMWAGNTVPTGWLVCDGSAISRTDYPLLFDAIGTLWGAGDGSTTFNLPNLKGRVPVGQDTSDTAFNAVGKHDGGAKTHLHTTGDFKLLETHIPAHTHGSKTVSYSFTIRRQGSNSVSAWGVSNTSVAASGQKNITSNAVGTGSQYGDTLTLSASHTHDSVGGGSAHNHGNTGNGSSLQPYAVVKYIICAK